MGFHRLRIVTVLSYPYLWSPAQLCGAVLWRLHHNLLTDIALYLGVAQSAHCTLPNKVTHICENIVCITVDIPTVLSRVTWYKQDHAGEMTTITVVDSHFDNYHLLPINQQTSLFTIMLEVRNT